MTETLSTLLPKRLEWNRLINSKWPKDLPIPSDQEAIAGAKRLYKRGMGRPFTGKVVITSGNRYTWIRRGVMYVNPDPRWGYKGWAGIVHLLAHYCHSRKHPTEGAHSWKEIDMEADLTRYAIEHGFHEGKLKRERRVKAKPDPKVLGLDKASAALRRWEAKQKRAETAIRKYRKKLRYYTKAIGE